MDSYQGLKHVFFEWIHLLLDLTSFCQFVEALGIL
jgi:hypothetical protein